MKSRKIRGSGYRNMAHVEGKKNAQVYGVADCKQRRN